MTPEWYEGTEAVAGALLLRSRPYLEPLRVGVAGASAIEACSQSKARR
jgi:hypothetical protein